MRKTGIGIAISAAFLLSGCSTTIEDFMVMSPEERVAFVCANHDTGSALYREVVSLTNSLAVVRNNISRGYALHNQCRDQLVSDGFVTDCRRDRNGNQHCFTRERHRIVRLCNDVPVPIDVGAERMKEAEMQQRLAAISAEYEKFSSECRKSVLEMSPQEAFAYWKSTDR